MRGRRLGLKSVDTGHAEARIEALRRTQLLDTPPEAAFDRLTSLVCTLLKAPVSLVSLIDSDRQFFKSASGLAEPWASLREAPLTGAFCKEVVDSEVSLSVNDAAAPAWLQFSVAAEALNIRAYLGVPLFTPEGQPIGTLCAVDDQPRSWSPHDLCVLGELADIAMSEIATRRYRLERDAAERALHHLAYHDALTGLPNRAFLSPYLTRAAEQGRALAVLFLDLDDFKLLNDSLGHAFGDRVLQHVAGRLQRAVQTNDVVARLGGDEFVVVLESPPHLLGAVAERLLGALGAPFSLAGRAVKLAASVGVATLRSGESAEEVLRRADLAMYRSKRSGKGTLSYFTPQLNDQAVARLTLASDFQRALSQQQFVLHYQPRVSLGANTFTGAEALVRWQHPQRGLLLPDDFVSAAEECGLIYDLGRVVLEQACQKLAEWRRRGFATPLSLNVSVNQLRHPSFLRDVVQATARHSIGAGTLEFEITESIFMQPSGEVLETLRALKSLGIKLSLDDFGTGYSSLAALKQLPFDTLKLDRSFLADATPASLKDVAIMRAVTELAGALGLTVVAEGVETLWQRDFALSAGCEEGQGFFYGRAVEAATLEQQFLAL